MAAVVCVMCQRSFAGRADARYCSAACRQKAHRNRTARRSRGIVDSVDGRRRSPAATRSAELTARARAAVSRSEHLCQAAAALLVQATRSHPHVTPRLPRAVDPGGLSRG
jgi:hypothetical protein